jgi:hypothetical protein
MGAYGPQNSPPETSLAPESSFLIQSLRSIMTTGASSLSFASAMIANSQRAPVGRNGRC